MKIFVNQSLKGDNDKESRNMKLYSMPITRIRSNHPTKDKHFCSSLNPLQTFKMEQHFTLLRLPINEVFNAINEKPLVRRPRLIQSDRTFFGVEEYCSYCDSKGHHAVHCKNLQRYLTKTPSKSTFLPLRQSMVQDNQALHLLPNHNM